MGYKEHLCYKRRFVSCTQYTVKIASSVADACNFLMDPDPTVEHGTYII